MAVTDATEPLAGFEERLVERRGARIRYFTGGPPDAPPLLLVHGFGGAAWNFADLAPLLARRHRLVIPDLPGHGGSAPLPAVASLASYAEALVTTCHEEGLERDVDVVGHSMGGTVALRLAVRRPELVGRLVLAAAAGISSATRMAEVFLTFAAVVQPARRLGRWPDAIARSPLLRRVVFTSFTVADPTSLSDRAVHGFLRGPREHSDVLSAARALARDDPRRDLDRVACPVLCLWGARDEQVPVDDAFEYARRLRAPVRLIADCGHLLVGERPDACADAIERFLDRGN
jgi:pimeloyl-ACP methyl ester carboxylesterase